MKPNELHENLIATPDEINRLWQHGLHEERLFHDRLNYFSVLEMGFLTICGILYNKESALGLFLPLTAVALVFTLLWLAIQMRHWRYCLHVNNRIKGLVPEYRRTVMAFDGPRHSNGLSISEPLAMGVPLLFAMTWVAFLVWIFVRPIAGEPVQQFPSVERVLLIAVVSVLVWIMVKLRRIEQRLRQVSDR